MHSKLDEEKSVPLLYVLASMHFIEQYTWSTQVLEKTHKRYVSSRILGAFKGKKKSGEGNVHCHARLVGP